MAKRGYRPVLGAGILLALTGCGGPDLGSSGRNGAFDNGLTGNFSGFGGNSTGRNGTGQNSVTRGHGTYARLETSFEVPDLEGNPFDYAANDIQVTFTTQDNRNTKVPAFFDGNKTWRVRYTPDMTGKLTITRFTRNGKEFTPDKVEKREFDVSGSPQPGFVRRDAKDKTRFAFDNGNSYYPIGHNVAWGEAKTNTIPATFEKMGKAGENWSRVWMAHWGGQNLDWLEGQKSEPGALNLEVAKKWDEIVEGAEKSGVYFQMVLQHHGQYSTRADANWDSNPWNKKNGGFLSTPDEFFTNPQAIALTKAKYRYIIARWGYSPSVLAWELFNEVENTDAVFHKHQDEVATWHNAMAEFLREQDPYKRLVTSSSGMDMALLGKNLDFYQPHAYPADPLGTVTSIDMRKADRPVFFGEIGPAGREKADLAPFLHRALWASIVSESSGAAQSWYWQGVEKEDLYARFKSASDFVRQSGLISKRGLLPAAAGIETTERAPLIVSPGAGYVASKQTEFSVLPSGVVEGIGSMPAYLQGTAKKEMFPGATFKVTYPSEGTFSVAVGSASKNGAHVIVQVDGATVAEKAFPAADKDTMANATLEAKVPAGAHTIRIENSGADWVTIPRLTFASVAPALGSVGKSGKDYAALWVFNRLADGSEKAPEAGVKGKITVGGLQPGSYKATWWDTAAGKVASEQTATAASAEGLTLETPAIQRDMAVYITKSGDKTASKPAASDKANGKANDNKKGTATKATK
jgi:hypothetical protein